MRDLFIKTDNTIEFALKKFTKTGSNTLVVIGKGDKLVGTLSNGDIRKGILKKKNLKSSISNLYNKKPTYFFLNNYTKKQAKETLINNHFDLIPVINKNEKVLKIIKLLDIIKEKKKKVRIKSLKVNAIIMAGGLGTRMAPFTDILPKPFLPINGRPVISHIIENFKKNGINNLWITTNHKSNLIKSYIKEAEIESNINFYQEKKPLGTVGSLRYMKKKLSNPVLLTNCDTIINTDFSEILKFHEKNRYDITIVVALKKINIPYGVCSLDEYENFLKIEEKPNIEFLVNTGMYVINSDILNKIPAKKYDMTDLISSLRENKKNIGLYPIQENYWNDVGNWKEYSKTLSLINK